MQVFTTIFLVETLRANIACVEENDQIDQNHPGAIEFKETLKEFIYRLERRNFLLSTIPISIEVGIGQARLTERE